jgi:hypothetical protein
MASAPVTVKVSGVDCLVVEPVETPCHDSEAACLVAGPAEAPCWWEAVCLIAEPAETQCLDWEAVEAGGDIERA